MAVGTARYRALKEKIISRLIERLPDTMAEAKDYAAKTLDIENLIVGKMDQLTPEQYSWSSSRTIRSDPPTPV